MKSHKRKSDSKIGWKIPQNAADYFDPHYDDSFKAKHPFLYFLTVVIIIILVVSGPFPFLAFCGTLNVQIESLFEGLLLLMGFISSFGISIGLCNVFMILHKQYLGHYVTIISLLIGIIGGGGSMAIIWLLNR